MTRYSLDQSTRLPPGRDVVIGGSPLRLFRLTPAGREVVERISAGHELNSSPAVDAVGTRRRMSRAHGLDAAVRNAEPRVLDDAQAPVRKRRHELAQSGDDDVRTQPRR